MDSPMRKFSGSKALSASAFLLIFGTSFKQHCLYRADFRTGDPNQLTTYVTDFLTVLGRAFFSTLSTTIFGRRVGDQSRSSLTKSLLRLSEGSPMRLRLFQSDLTIIFHPFILPKVMQSFRFTRPIFPLLVQACFHI